MNKKIFGSGTDADIDLACPQLQCERRPELDGGPVIYDNSLWILPGKPDWTISDRGSATVNGTKIEVSK